jgi:hypothetical protein
MPIMLVAFRIEGLMEGASAGLMEGASAASPST